MERRGFLRLLGLSAAAFALDPERLLWVPGQKTIVDLGSRIVLPEMTVERLNTFLTVEMITRESLRVLEHSLKVMKTVNRQYSDGLMADMDRVRW